MGKYRVAKDEREENKCGLAYWLENGRGKNDKSLSSKKVAGAACEVQKVQLYH